VFLGLVLLVCVHVDGFAGGLLPDECILRLNVIDFISADLDFLFILAMLSELHVSSLFSDLFFLFRFMLDPNIL
jgi:hypothetical protein